jgi:two-component system LytT family sensor kinase
VKIRSTYFIPGIHILVWVLFFVIMAVIFNDVKFDTGLPGYFFTVTNFYHIALFYFNVYFLYPKLVTRKWWWLYPPALAILIIFSYYAKIFFLHLADPSFTLTHINCRIIFFPPFPFIIAGIIFRIITGRIQREKLQKEQQAERLATELKFLRSQVSPHFLFNMMTNMVSLARQKSDLLEPSLIKLSDMLRYMLYEPGDEKFTVSNEIAYLKNYIELQQLRFGDDVAVEVQIENNQPDCFIEPMLLIPFVENAFKHGIGMVRNPYIKIYISIKEQTLFFSVINGYNKNNLSKDKNSGIGLENVKHRLQLLYPGNYTLSIKDKDDVFKAELKLNLAC